MISYTANRSTIAHVAAHLARCDAHFIPPLSSRVDISAYAAKVVSHAERFEAWTEDGLVGLIAAYCNDPERQEGFITSVSVVPERHGRGIATRLLRNCIDHAQAAGFLSISLQVRRNQGTAIRLYEKCGFSEALAGQPDVTAEQPDVTMTLELTEIPERHARL
jgi:ribosomal protein S18 acetylase RimI-like enzyme